MAQYGIEDLINQAFSGGLKTDLGITPFGAHVNQGSLNSVQTLQNFPGEVKGVLVQALTQNIRYTIGGTTPTTSLGFRLVAGDSPYIIPVSPTTVLKFIEETASASLQYQYVK